VSGFYFDRAIFIIYGELGAKQPRPEKKPKTARDNWRSSCQKQKNKLRNKFRPVNCASRKICPWRLLTISL
jgi:hypothetical protein